MQSKSSMARLAMMELSNLLSVPMSLNAVVRLNVPEAIYQSGLNAPLTAAEILAFLRPPPPPTADPSNLQRLLRLLASHGVFREDVGSDGRRRYSLTDVGMTLVSVDGGPSYAAYVMQHHQDTVVRAWPVLHEAVLDPHLTPFARVHGGVNAYEYYGKVSEANELMQAAMWGVSTPFMAAFLDGYGSDGGFKGVHTLVDVGGSSGACLHMVMKRFSGIKTGINLDLPEVVASAPKFPGVTHVGGDMLKSIPPGDVIFMKWILTSSTDDECVTILKNCYHSLPVEGKAIVCDLAIPENTDDRQRTRMLLEADIFLMAICRAKARDRSEAEFKQLGLSAGFTHFRAIYLDHFFTVMEFTK